MSLKVGEGFRVFWSTWPGRIGLALLITLTLVSLYTLTFLPISEISRQWNNPQYWADNPKNTPPVWVNLFSDKKLIETKILSASKSTFSPGSNVNLYMEFLEDSFPEYLSFSIYQLEYTASPPVIILSVTRPDGYTLELARITTSPPRPDETPPYVRYNQAPERVLLSSSMELARTLSAFYIDKFDISVSPLRVLQEGPQKYLFGKPRDDEIVPLRGVYRFTLTSAHSRGEVTVNSVQLVFGGEVFGFMGTDVIGRDLALGLLLGFPISLFVGVISSVVVTNIGASLGLISGYFGGRVDNLIQRAADFINNIPVLPLLIFLVFSFGAKLWIIFLAFVVFGWPGLTIVIRSIVLQLREAQFIESSKAIGASSMRIIVRHIFPHIAPYVLAQMIFLTPSFILLEAALSFLGLGDPSLPTWGQILELGFRNAAVYLGFWWWILPPGILIIITALTFVMVALGLEPVINPRIRMGGRR